MTNGKLEKNAVVKIMWAYLHNQLAYRVASNGDIEVNLRIRGFFTHASRLDAETPQNSR